ncbi:MAG: hypothetical protein CL840_10420 [Crocinitomicaceae bacterium]|nr:hypothetical protein [Crocinitomicaceae bacterium]|tara:strand:- start:6996 stop:8120 length:1125 start_codon:yes stop_codon:yes gene_type:complete
MIDLGKQIKSLLYDHDCVIIPQFGGFVANPHPAKINKLKSRIDPPFKEIGFNPRLTKNDGLLANQVHNDLQLTYEQAIEQIQNVVDDIKATVNSGSTYRMEEIGSFYLDSGKNLRFSAFNKTNFNLDFFGFEAVQAISFDSIDKSVQLKKEEVQAREIPIEKATALTKDSAPRKKRNWVNTAMVAACIPLLMYLLWVPTHIDLQADRINFQASDLNPYVKPPCPMYEAREGIPEIIELKRQETDFYKSVVDSKRPFITTSFFSKSDANYSENELITIRLSGYKALPLSTRVAHAFVPPNQLMRYYVIAGCFREYSNANSFINKLRLQGFNSSLIDKKGDLYRVSIAGSNGREEILKLLGDVKSRGHTDAWVLKK